MLKLGNTYISFGGDLISNWRPNKEPVLDNGWRELYHIDPNTFKAYTMNGQLAGPQLMGANSSYIDSGYYQPYSGYVSQFPAGGQFNLYEDTNSANLGIYTTTFASDNPNYYLAHIQIAPHIIYGSVRYCVEDLAYWDNLTGRFNGKTYIGSAALLSAVDTYFKERMMPESVSDYRFSLNDTWYKLTVQPLHFFEIEDNQENYKRNFASVYSVDQSVAETPIEVLDWYYDPETEEEWQAPWQYVEMNDGGPVARRSFIRPFTVNLLIKNEANTNTLISSYFNGYGWPDGSQYINSAEDIYNKGNSGDFTKLNFCTFNTKQLNRNSWVSANSATLPSLTYTGKMNGATWSQTGTYQADEVLQSFFLYRGFEVADFGISGCYVDDPSANEMLDKLMNRSYSGNV